MPVVDAVTTKLFVQKVGTAVKLTATATGNLLSYHWKKDGALIADALPGRSGTLTKTLSLSGLAETDTGNYACEVTAPGGMLDSAVQRVAVTRGRAETRCPRPEPGRRFRGPR